MIVSIPNFDDELKRLSEVAPAGWTLAFNYSWRGPEHIFVGYPDAWREEYEGKNYIIGDPVMLWIMARDSGFSRWSELNTPDLRGVMKRAASQNLRFGAVFTRRVKLSKSFLSIARSDREFTDEEIAEYNVRFNFWVDALMNRALLKPGELDVLRCFSKGLSQSETAEALKISESAVKQRFVKICAKLQASTRTQAVAIAVQRNYLAE